MNDLQEITRAIIKFRDERDWAQFHDTKNLAVAISIEAAELNELFLWKTVEQCENVDRQRLKEELADILTFSFLLAQKHGLDIREIIMDKLNLNSKKYPVDKAKGKATKYTEL